MYPRYHGAMDSGSYRTVLRGKPGQRLVYFVLLCAVVLFSLWATNRTTHRLAQASRSVERTFSVLLALQQTLSAVTDAETGQRGFTISGNEAFLARYDSAVPLVQVRLDSLRLQTADNATQQQRADTLRVLVAVKLENMATTIALRRTDAAAAMERVSAGGGKLAMDAVRAAIAGMETEERRLLALRTSNVGKVLRDTDRIALLAAAATLVMVVLLTRSVLRHTREIRRSAATLAEERERLQTTLASIGDAVIATDDVGRVTYLNAVAESLTGWTNDAAAGVPLTQVFVIVNQSTRLPVENPALRALRDGVIVGLANHTMLISRDGTERPIDDSAAPIRAQSGVVTGCVLVFRDITERYAVERQAEDLRHDMAQTLESITDGVMRMDGEWRVTHVNAEAARINRVLEADSIGRTIWEVLPAIVGTSMEAGYRRCMEQRGVVEFDNHVEEEGRWYAIRCYPIREGGLIVFVRDITGRKHAEAQLRHAKAEMDFALDAADLGWWSLNLEDGSAQRAPRHDQIFGYDTLLPAWTYEMFLEHVLPGDRAAVDASFRRAVDTGTTWHVSCRIRRADGALRQIWTTARVQLGRTGAVQRMLGIVGDVTEERDADAERTRLAFIVENAPDYIALADASGTPLFVNPAGRRLIGLPDDLDVATTAIPDYFVPEQHEFIRSVVMPANLAAGRWAGELTLRHFQSGEPIPVWCELFRVDDPLTGTVMNFATVIRDIRERKRAERAAAEADRRKDEFLATLAHELRNPLAPIRNGLYILELTGSDPVVIQARTMMERQVTNLVRLVDDLLDVSRVTTGKLTLQREPLDLRDVIDAGVETVQSSIIEAQHTLRITLPDTPVMLIGDRTRLTQVVANLLNNAARYTPKGGQISLELSRAAAMAEIRIRDTGVGIPTEQLEQIFEVFSQVHRALEKSTGGLGIGLSLVRGLVELHDGTVAATSEGAGLGSEFVVRLPALDREPGDVDEPGTTPPDHVEAPAQRRRILVADDNRDAVQSLAQLLTLLGHDVRTAADGEAAVAECKAFQPDVVLMDIGMPKLNGYDACRRMRVEPGGDERLLVALTGWGQDADRELSLDAGFDLHLVKPLRPGAVSRLLASLPDHTGKD